jgi:predicted XRE-type DNA-binding protein
MIGKAPSTAVASELEPPQAMRTKSAIEALRSWSGIDSTPWRSISPGCGVARSLIGFNWEARRKAGLRWTLAWYYLRVHQLPPPLQSLATTSTAIPAGRGNRWLRLEPVRVKFLREQGGAVEGEIWLWRRSDLGRLHSEVVRVRKDTDSEHGPRHVTSIGRSVFYDLFAPEKAAAMEMRAQLMIGLRHWLEESRLTQAEAAKVLGATQARVSDLKRGKIDRLIMDLLVRLAARAGLKPKLKLAA